MPHMKHKFESTLTWKESHIDDHFFSSYPLCYALTSLVFTEPYLMIPLNLSRKRISPLWHTLKLKPLSWLTLSHGLLLIYYLTRYHPWWGQSPATPLEQVSTKRFRAKVELNNVTIWHYFVSTAQKTTNHNNESIAPIIVKTSQKSCAVIPLYFCGTTSRHQPQHHGPDFLKIAMKRNFCHLLMNIISVRPWNLHCE